MELIKINTTDFEKTVLENKGLSERAVKAIMDTVKQLPIISDTLSLEQGNQIESNVNNIRARAQESVKINKERRMVYTRQFDEIKKVFTEQEKSIEEAAEGLANWQNQWNSEKIKRAKIEEEKKQAQLQKDNAKIDYQTYVNNQIRDAYNLFISEELADIDDDFYKLSIEGLQRKAETLPKLVPEKLDLSKILKDTVIQNHPLLNDVEMTEIREMSFNAANAVLSAEYEELLNREREKTLSRIPGRIEELKRIADNEEEARKAADRIAKEKEERLKQQEEEIKKLKAQAEMEAAMAKTENAIEAEITSEMPKVSKGTSVKQKYDPQDHAEFLKILQWWVVNIMPLMTIDELNKKLSFMRTAASEELNKGVTIDGVKIIEDIRTRISKK